jgi:hypothetical protein
MGRQNPGYIINLGNATRGLTGQISAQSTSSSPVVLITGVANVFNDIITLIFTNETNAPTVVLVSDGTLTYRFAISPYGGGVFNFLTPLPASNMSTNWTFSNTANATIDCVGTYAINPNPSQ